MALRLGDTAPNFTAKTSIGEIDFHQFLGESWGILFSHPADFTPVCTTELGTTAKLTNEFIARNTKVLALSVDGVDSHHEWIKDINETQQTRVNFPIIADEDRTISELYDMIHPNASATLTVRSLFIIAPDKTIKLIITYPGFYRTKLPGDPACSGFAAINSELQRCNSGRLEARRRCSGCSGN